MLTTKEHKALVRQLPWRCRVLHFFIGALASKNMLEAFFSVFSLVWGTCMVVFGRAQFAEPAFSGMHLLFDGQHWPLGFPIIPGLVGIYALLVGSRPLRAFSSILAGLFWFSLVTYFLFRVPPSVSAMLVYGGFALGELIVFLRVWYGFDRLTPARVIDHV